MRRWRSTAGAGRKPRKKQGDRLLKRPGKRYPAASPPGSAEAAMRRLPWCGQSSRPSHAAPVRRRRAGARGPARKAAWIHDHLPRPAGSHDLLPRKTSARQRRCRSHDLTPCRRNQTAAEAQASASPTAAGISRNIQVCSAMVHASALPSPACADQQAMREHRAQRTRWLRTARAGTRFTGAGQCEGGPLGPPLLFLNPALSPSRS